MALRIRPHARSTRWRCPRASAGRSCRCADHGVAADVAATSGAATCGDHGGFAGTAAGLTAAPAGPAAGRRLAGRENRGGAGGVPEARAVAATRAPSVLAADAAVLIRCPRHRPWPRWLLRPQLSTRPPSPRRGDFEASVLDIGQGHAALVRSRDHPLLLEAGARFFSGFDLGEAPDGASCAAAIARTGGTTIAVMILTLAWQP